MNIGSGKSKRKRESAPVPKAVGQFDAEVRVLLADLSREDGPVLRCLQRIQEHFGYVPESEIGVIAELCNVSRAEVFGVLTYYSDLRTTPPADVTVGLCAAEACQSVGSRELDADWHHVASKDFAGASVEVREMFCLGNCALGPAAMVNGELIGRATSEKISDRVSVILAKSQGVAK